MIRSDRTAETCPSQLCVSSHCGIKYSSKRDGWGGEVQKQTELLGLQFFSLLVLCLQVSNRRSSSSEKADSVKGGLKGRHQIGWSERLQPPSDEVPCLSSFFTDRLLHWLNVWWCLCNLNDPQCNRSEATPGMCGAFKNTLFLNSLVAYFTLDCPYPMIEHVLCWSWLVKVVQVSQISSPVSEDSTWISHVCFGTVKGPEGHLHHLNLHQVIKQSVSAEKYDCCHQKPSL